MTGDQPADRDDDGSDDHSDSENESIDSISSSDDTADDGSATDSDSTASNDTTAGNDTATDTDATETSTLDIGSVAADDIEDDEPRYERSLPGVVIHPLAFLGLVVGALPEAGLYLAARTPFTKATAYPLAFFGLVGLGALPAAGLYLAARTPFTRANARNALNWHLSVLCLGVGTVLALGVGRTEGILTGELIDWQLLPGVVATLVGLVGLLLVIFWMVAWLLTVVFAVVATFNAVVGYTWRYPFAPDIVGWFGKRD